MASLATTTPRQTPQVLAARCIVLKGGVQGYGVRPAIHRLAAALSLAGVVRNSARGVEIHIEGAPNAIAEFELRLPHAAPTGACFSGVDSSEVEPHGYCSFSIELAGDGGSLATSVPQDVAVCESCLEELRDPANRRFNYPFTSCTSCGPRYSILRRMPYERAETTMAKFPLCPACQQEYISPRDRRFHAQTNACPQCGPQVWFVDSDYQKRGERDGAIQLAVQALRDGQIVAVQGLGGYQLLVDGGSDEAVARLRARKYRPSKPLAVMVGSLEAAGRYADLDDMEREALASPSNPIVLVRAKSSTPLAASIHPGVNTLGLLLPTTPLHAILLHRFDGPVVCTSGNREGEPLEYENEQAEEHLRGICDAWLHHNRPIARPIDDSVVRVIAGKAVTLRLARGLAPLPLELPAAPPILALGGHMKAAVAWSSGAVAALGPHVGDLDTLAARDRYAEQTQAWGELFRLRPECIAHDLHPEYHTSRRAAELAAEFGSETIAVQHHHAHVVAGMLQQGWLDQTVLGVAWDGTGYAAGGEIWGGEFLIATATGFQRFAHLRTMSLPGAEAAIRQPWRMAVALLQESLGGAFEACLKQSDRPPILKHPRVKPLLQMLSQARLWPETSSAGRLFDAVAAIVLDLEDSQHEGQAAMMLEAAADPTEQGAYHLSIVEGGQLELDWRPLIRQLVEDKRAGDAVGAMAMKFHRALAEVVVEVCSRRPELPVVLAGGVFQNRLLTELIVERTANSPQVYGLPGAISPGDGGLAAGQLAIAIARRNASCV